MEIMSLLLGLILGLIIGVAVIWFSFRKSEVKINEIAGSIYGDIAGRDIQKNSYLYKSIRAASRDKNAAILRIIRHEWTTQDPTLISRLHEIPRRENWFEKYVEVIFSMDSFSDYIMQLENNLKGNNWRLISVSPNDNIENGLILDLTVEKIVD